jgi:hypothetical protein
MPFIARWPVGTACLKKGKLAQIGAPSIRQKRDQ